LDIEHLFLPELEQAINQLSLLKRYKAKREIEAHLLTILLRLLKDMPDASFAANIEKLF